MNRLELKPQPKLTLSFEGVDYPMVRPPLGVVADFEDKLDVAKKTKKGVVRLLMTFVSDCGLPATVVDKIDGEGLEAIMDFLTPGKKN